MISFMQSHVLGSGVYYCLAVLHNNEMGEVKWQHY